MATTSNTGPNSVAQVGTPDQPSGILPPGAKAPDFRLNATPDEKLGPSDFKGKNLVLVFYPADWSPVCSDEMVVFNELLPEFKRLNAEVLGISVDGTWSHMAFERDRNLRYPLLSDFEPKGQVSRAYGAYRDAEGVSDRAIFVLDGEGMIRWSYLSPVGINPGADGVLNALEAIAAQPRCDQAGSPPAAARQENVTPTGSMPAEPDRFARGKSARPDRRTQEASHGDRRSAPNAQSPRQ